MAAPEFQVLTNAELAKLSHEERVEYMKGLIEYMREQSQYIQKAIDARNEQLKKSE